MEGGHGVPPDLQAGASAPELELLGSGEPVFSSDALFLMELCLHCEDISPALSLMLQPGVVEQN